MIQFIVVSSFFLQDYISFMFSLVFFFVVFISGVVVFHLFFTLQSLFISAYKLEAASDFFGFLHLLQLLFLSNL